MSKGSVNNQMSKGKKFTAAEKHFQGIIDSKNKMIMLLSKSRDKLIDEKYQLIKENEELKSKLERATIMIIELNKLTNLSAEDIKTLVDKSNNVNKAIEMLNVVGNIGLY